MLNNRLKADNSNNKRHILYDKICIKADCYKSINNKILLFFKTIKYLFIQNKKKHTITYIFNDCGENVVIIKIAMSRLRALRQ